MAIALERNASAVTGGSFGPQWDLGDEEIEQLIVVIRSGKLSRLGGTKVVQLEQDFAARVGARYAQAVTSGTAAVHTAVGVLDPNPGDEIITTGVTDFGTVIGLLYQNAVPVFADVDPRTGNLDPASVESLITERTRAIVLVHLYGNPCPLDAFVALAKKHNLALVEDCAQAQGAEYGGRSVGTWGDLGCFSFGGKQMTTGDGGMVITHRDDLAERLKWFPDKGNPRRPHYQHYYLSPNYRMTELQGAVGVAQLRKVDEVVRRKRAAAAYLNEVVSRQEGLRVTPVQPGAKHAYWVYGFQIDPSVIRVPVADFARALQAEGVPVNAPYLEKPIYQYPALAEPHLYGESRFPWTLPGAAEVDFANLHLPGVETFLATTAVLTMNPSFTQAHVQHFGDAIQKVAARYRDQR